MLVIALVVAALLTYRQRGWEGIKRLLKSAFDFKRIDYKVWYVPILFLSPLNYFLSYVVMRLVGPPLPDPNILILRVPVLLLVFFIAAIFGELGWTGYALDPLQNRWGALKSGIMLGIIWQLWHLIPDLQLGYSTSWIFWHGLHGVALRIIMVWIFNNTGKSVFSSVLVYAMHNLS